MIDWCDMVIPLDHPIDRPFSKGFYLVYEPDEYGNDRLVKHVPKRLPVEGSHSSNIHIRTTAENLIYVSGNPLKFLQGHNVFGSDDLRAIIPHFMLALCRVLGVIPSQKNIEDWIAGNYYLKRVDINQMYSMDTRPDVLVWIKAAEQQGTTRQGKAIMTGNTVYFQKNSKRWAFKFYSKGDELDSKNHKLHPDIPMREELMAFADNSLRGELSLRTPELERLGKAMGNQWNLGSGDALQLHQDFQGKLKMPGQVTLPLDVLQGLPGRLQMVYQSWQRGDDLRAILPKPTYYRYRQELLKHGVDINVHRPKTDQNVFPLVHALRPQAVSQIPSWAVGTPLYFDPSQKLRVA